jgi:hypothetical protein
VKRRIWVYGSIRDDAKGASGSMIPDDSATPVLRQISVRAVMDVLLNSGATSRAALAKITGLSKQTMSEVIRVLESGGFVRVKGVTSGKVGRAAVIYESTPRAAMSSAPNSGHFASPVARQHRR